MDTYIPIGEAAKYLGVTVKTLQRWDREGVLKPEARTSTNRRVYTKGQLSAYLGNKQVPKVRFVVAYSRVSSQAQKSDLRNQRLALEAFCAARGFADVEYVDEVGGGLNLTRKKFVDLMDRVERGEISTLVVAHKDRLARFGFEWFQLFCEKHHCELLVLNSESLSPEQEMTQDLLAIVHCFSARLYGLRNYRKAIEKAVSEGSDAPVA